MKRGRAGSGDGVGVSRTEQGPKREYGRGDGGSESSSRKRIGEGQEGDGGVGGVEKPFDILLPLLPPLRLPPRRLLARGVPQGGFVPSLSSLLLDFVSFLLLPLLDLPPAAPVEPPDGGDVSELPFLPFPPRFLLGVGGGDRLGLVTVMRRRVEDRSLTAGRRLRREDGEEPGDGEREDRTHVDRRRDFFLGRYCDGEREK